MLLAYLMDKVEDPNSQVMGKSGGGPGCKKGLFRLEC